MNSLEHISEMSSWNLRGGQVLDFLSLKDGRALVISEDAVVLYASQEELETGDPIDRPTIFL